MDTKELKKEIELLRDKLDLLESIEELQEKIKELEVPSTQFYPWFQCIPIYQPNTLPYPHYPWDQPVVTCNSHSCTVESLKGDSNHAYNDQKIEVGSV
jgi:hypothetical protein